uniref:NADH-ubiquinone oxidoreductase chain 5 n=1 Tax=Metacrangonyx dominicanus TaxID=1199168 RepID=K7ZVM1_9CRUS|nr:NADH dehydrogenase subunit 5 [Metacrangonyx dominicanus]CCI69362.1 NADH dehydrogenase subunit 5 [Metacrangonyx dominicanus]
MKVKDSVYYICMSCMFFVSFISLFMAMNLMMKEKSIFFEWELLFFNGTSIIFLLLLDTMSAMFLFTVCLISGVICGYSKYYMSGEQHFLRFMLIMMLFVGSMMLLILSPNLISLLLGWDGLGLSSYILVIYYQNEYACNSGMLTILSNRIGDSMLLICICLMFSNNSWNFMLETVSSKLLLILLISGAMTKSAQVPFSAWLPAAMAAPTPVSALVHSSTLVTAGVYLLIRFYPCMYDSSVYMFLLITSSMTMMMSGWMANFEMDMKKIIALSTLSQLGLMMIVISLGKPELAFFHLITHAMFKSTIFMCAGVMIHNMNNSQDLRGAGNFFTAGPLLGLFFSITNMSLCGFPFLAGFFSKDLLLENILSYDMNFFFHLFTMMGVGLTISYSLRVLFYMSNTVSASINTQLKEMSLYLTSIMFVMIIMSMTSGFILSWLYLPMICVYMNLTHFYKFFVVGATIVFFSMSWMVMKSSHMYMTMKMNIFKKGSHLMMFLPYISSQMSAMNPLMESYYFNKIIDSGWLEYLFGMYMYKNFEFMNYNLMFSQISKFLKIILISLFLMTALLMNFA